MSNKTDWFFDSSEFDPSATVQTTKNFAQTSQPSSCYHEKRYFIIDLEKELSFQI